MQSEAWMIVFLLKKIFYFFKRLILGGIFLTNRHLFIFTSHGSHVTFEAIEQAQAFGLYMVILHSHTSHALQPLAVTYFKPFKTIFKKERNTTMINKNYVELDKMFWQDRWTSITPNILKKKYHLRVQKYKDLAIGP